MNKITAPRKFKPGLVMLISLLKSFAIVGLIVLALAGLQFLAAVAINYDKQHTTK